MAKGKRRRDQRKLSETDRLRQRVRGLETALAKAQAQPVATGDGAAFRHILDALPDPVYRCLPDGKITYANAAFSKLCGQPLPKLIGSSLLQFFSDENRDGEATRLRERAQAKRTETITREWRAADGRPLWLEWVETPISTPDGSLAAYQCFGRNVTHYHSADSTAPDGESFLRSILNSHPEPFFAKDEEHRWVFLNKAASVVMGHPVEELIGKSDYDLFSKEQADEFWEHDKAALTKGIDINEEIITWHGQEHLISTIKSAYTDPASGKRYIVGAIRDVTELKNGEMRLREELSFTNRILEESPDLILGVSPQGTIYYLNPAAQTLCGVSSDEAIGKTWCELITPEEQQGAAAVLFEQLREGDVDEIESEMLCAKGKRRIVRWRIHRRLNNDGNLQELVLFGRESTARAAAEKQQRQLEKMQALGKLAGGIAHDFNNQLVGILGFANLLAAAITDPEQQEWAMGIIRSATHGTQLTHKLLSFARPKQGTLEPIETHALIRDALALAKHSLGNRITVTTDLAAANDTIHGDGSAIQNAFLNLILNANDAMPHGGTIAISTTTCELTMQGNKRFPYDVPPGDYIQVDVRDTGLGMDAETQSRMFEPFFTTKADGGGTGMGLSSVYGTVRQHGGAIDIESTPGEGTRMRLYFPCLATSRPNAPKTTDAADAPKPAAKDKSGGKSILIIDDEPMVGDLISTILEKDGYYVRTETDPEAAIQTFAKASDPFDLVLVDMIMPKLDGEEVFAELNALAPQTPILLMTGLADPESVETLLSIGAREILYKPFTPEELRATLIPYLN